jgi:hypothetical protein
MASDDREFLLRLLEPSLGVSDKEKLMLLHQRRAMEPEIGLVRQHRRGDDSYNAGYFVVHPSGEGIGTGEDTSPYQFVISGV